MTRGNRKIGLGIMGWAELLFARGVRYGSRESLELAEKTMGFIQRIGHDESEVLAGERGSFPNWKGSVWETRGRPMRNATVTTIAPTGTISLIAECSSGIEPVFALAFRRKAFDNDTLIYINGFLEQAMAKMGESSAAVLEQVLASGALSEADVPHQLKDVFVTAHDIPYREHVEMQAAFQKYTDNAVSKTINLPHESTRDDVRDSYLMAYSLGCKGITVYRDRCKETQVLYRGTDETAPAPKLEAGGRAKPRRRPSNLQGSTVKILTSFGNLYLTLNMFGGEAFELFATLGKSGKDTQAHTEALGRLISLSLRSGVPIRDIIEQLKGIGGSQPVLADPDMILSLPDAIAHGLERALGEKVEITSGDMCPSCGAPLVHAEGCMRCISCDYSKCF
jgi:ribonucleoside-diphosphate reductase alpha chain